MTTRSDDLEVDVEPVATDDVTDGLVLVSNREPYRHEYVSDEQADVDVDTPAGGLASGLDPVMQRVDGTWVAWGDGDADFAVADDGAVEVPPSNPSYTLQRVDLSAEQVRGYYDGYANGVLWPLCHSMPGRVDVDPEEWEQYRAVNERFADEALDCAGDGGSIWFQDYHFMLAPQIVRDRWPDGFCFQFLHVPWPSPDVFRVCPHAEQLLRGLLGNDLLGLHRPRYVASFLECADQLLPDARVDWGENRVHVDGHTTTVEAFPLGVDADEIRRSVSDADGSFWTRFREEHGIDESTTTAIGVDRLDYTKGIPERLDALERAFETHPELRGELTYVQKACPTRERVPAYQRLRETIEEKIDALNDRFGTDEWTPVVYTTEYYDREELYSLYRHSDLGVVTPLRDGMNLVAKEYVASQVDNDGALLLSPMAGAYGELSEGAVEFDPYDPAAADSLVAALEMDDAERRTRIRRLRRQVHDADLAAWIDDVLATARDVEATGR